MLLSVNAHIPESLRVRILELGINPSSVLKVALRKKVRELEEKHDLEAVRRFDPRITLEELRSDSAEIRKLKRMASVNDSSVEA